MTTKKYVFTAGLPRAGSTLAASILSQNPKFQSSISGPLARYVRAIIQESNSQGGYRFECPPAKRKSIIKGIFDNYYDDSEKTVCFNHNRGWPLLHHTLKDLYPNSKMIVFIRDIEQILNSFEWLHKKNPYEFSSMFSPNENINVYSRCESLLSNERMLGFSWAATKQALSSEYKSDIMFIDYVQLASFPVQTIKALYKFIDEPLFNHDFNNVEYSNDEFDSEIGIPGLHTTRKVVEYKPQPMIIPPDIIQSVKGMNVWK